MVDDKRPGIEAHFQSTSDVRFELKFISEPTEGQLELLAKELTDIAALLRMQRIRQQLKIKENP